MRSAEEWALEILMLQWGNRQKEAAQILRAYAREVGEAVREDDAAQLEAMASRRDPVDKDAANIFRRGAVAIRQIEVKTP